MSNIDNALLAEEARAAIDATPKDLTSMKSAAEEAVRLNQSTIAKVDEVMAEAKASLAKRAAPSNVVQLSGMSVDPVFETGTVVERLGEHNGSTEASVADACAVTVEGPSFARSNNARVGS